MKERAIELVQQAIDENPEIEHKKTISKYIIVDKDGTYHIKSPKAFFSLLLEEYAPEKKKSFFRSYPNNEALAKIFDEEYSTKRLTDIGVFKTIVTKLQPSPVEDK